MKVVATFKLRCFPQAKASKRRLVVATFKLRCFPQAKASKRRLKPATTNYKKKKLLLTLLILIKGEKNGYNGNKYNSPGNKNTFGE